MNSSKGALRMLWRGGSGLPAPWTREQLLNIQANFCNRNDSSGRPIFSAFLATAPSLGDWLASMGGTHAPLAVTYQYDEPGFKYWGTPADWRSNIGGFVAILVAIIKQGKAPIVFLTQGNGAYNDPDGDPVWFQANGAALIAAILAAGAALGVDLTQYCVWVFGWEPDPQAIAIVIPIMRAALGPNAIIGLHLQQGYSHWSGDGGGCWYDPVGQEIDAMLFQNIYADPNEKDPYGQPAWEDICIETADRFLERGAPMPGADGHLYLDKNSGKVLSHPGNAIGPDYFAPPGRAKGRCPLVMFEVVAWGFVRLRFDQTWVNTVAQRASSFGVTRFGNGTLS